MACIICGGKPEKTKFGYRQPDKYEDQVGLHDIKRLWVRCAKCGFYWQLRNYPLADLEKIYRFEYRSKEFRGETIKHAYHRIRALPYSENEKRFFWFGYHAPYKNSKKVLDIGSGIGLWPKILMDAEYDVTCVDSNWESVNFIADELGLKCYYRLEDVDESFDTVTLIHVLEHVEDLGGFLKEVRARLRPYGNLFVECPDNSEFKWLSKDHDEFNSCHLWHFDMSSLSRLLRKHGFNPVDAHVVKYDSRGLTRIQMLCR